MGQPSTAAKLAVTQAILHHQQESAPQIPPGYKYVAGELMHVSFRIRGYQVKSDKVDLRWQLIGTDPEGLLLWEPLSGSIREEVTHNDENWLPRAVKSLPLPPQLPPGAYKLRIRIADELAHASAEQDLEFHVGGKPLPTVDKFTILNPAFYREEDARAPLTPPVFKPGDSVFARFDITGFALGERNKLDIEYGISVHRPSGKEMYAEPKAAALNEAPYYPKRLMHGGFSLTLTSDLTPGEYTVIVIAKDNIGAQTATYDMKFSVAK